LINIIGHASKLLFGTVTEEDINILKKHTKEELNDVKSTLRIVMKNIESQIKILSDIRKNSCSID
jgi:hypothetical protein